jgi:hypothetical protein
VDSDISLPELQETHSNAPTIFFQSTTASSLVVKSIKWFHHWTLPNGRISISVGKNEKDYWLQFPQIADFQINPAESQIICHNISNIPNDTIRHLLLDQVIPRLLSHLGKQVLHASCVQVGRSAIAFSGESGWGKSTLSAFFHSQGYPLLTDDCLLLQPKGSYIIAVPNYRGMRLFQDGLTLLPTEQHTVPVCHYGDKQRLIMTNINHEKPVPITAVFILKPPHFPLTNTPISITKITGASVAIELIKNCFPLDITDTKTMGTQLQKITVMASSKNLTIYSLDYPRDMKFLPNILESILDIIDT